MVALFGSLDSLLFSWSPCAWFVFCWFGWVFGCRLGSIVRVFFVRSSRKLSLLGEFPGGNQVDGLPPACRNSAHATEESKNLPDKIVTFQF